MGHLLLLLLLALLLASTHASFHAKAAADAVSVDKSLAGVIGSRPPSCAGRCRSCGHACEAVQVPVSPQELLRRRRRKKKKMELLGRHGGRTDGGVGGRAAMPSSYDDHSNYKPLSWRCKCGRHILNP